MQLKGPAIFCVQLKEEKGAYFLFNQLLTSTKTINFVIKQNKKWTLKNYREKTQLFGLECNIAEVSENIKQRKNVRKEFSRK